MIGKFAKNEKVIFNKEDMEELLKMKILKKHSRLKIDDNNRVNVNNNFDWLEEQETNYEGKFTLNPINMIEMELDNNEFIYE